MTRTLRWALQLFSIELRRMISYRASFWIQYLGNVTVTFLVAYFLWQAVYAASGKSEIGGYSFEKMVLYYMVARFVQRMLEGFDFSNILNDIYTGELNRCIVYPVSVVLWKYVTSLAELAVYGQQLLLSLGLYFIFLPPPIDAHISLSSAGMFFGAMLLSGALNFLCLFALGALAFWFEQVWTLMYMFRFAGALLGGAAIPLALFPEGLLSAARYLPFNVIFSFPIRALLGELSFSEWLNLSFLGLCWIAAAYVCCLFVLERGKRQYTGVGI